MNIKKVTQKGADGSSITYEFDVPKMQDVPAHPGGPKGPDTVPAWLTPGEFVMNAEATRMFEPQIEAMNDAGRVVQKQQGGTIPEYKADGGGVPGNPTVEQLEALKQSGAVDDYVDPFNQGIPQIPQILERTSPAFNPTGLDENTGATIGDLAGNVLGELGNMINVEKGIQTNKDNFNAIGDALSGVIDIDQGIQTNKDNFNYIKSIPGKVFTFDGEPGNPETGSAMIDEFGVGSLPGEGGGVIEREGTKDTLDVLDEVTNGVISTQSIRDSKDKDAVASSIIEVINDKDASDEAADIEEKKATEAGLAYLKEIEDIKSGKGPSDGDTGDIYTGSFLDKAEGLLSSVGSFFKDNFSTLLDDDKLKNAALLYLGSRAMGYSHAGSLNFVGKRYMGQIESKLKTADQAALTGKYSKESISKYRDTGNPSDLVMNKAYSIVGTKEMVNPKTGKTVAVTTYKDDNTGKLIHQNEDGKPIPNIGALRTQADEDAKFNNFKRTIVSNIKGELERIPDEETRDNILSVIPNPEGFAGEAYEVGRKLGLDTAKINSLVPSMIREMIRDTKSGITINETAVQSYFNKQLINLSLEELKVKANLNNANTQELSEINAMIPNSSNPVVLSTFWRGAGEAFGNLSNKEKKFYSDREDKKLGITPIMVFVKEELSELSK